MQQDYIIGIDIGTGSTKAVALTATGEVLNRSQQFYPSLTDGEKSEQDVYVVFAAFQQCIRQLVEAQKQPPQAVCLSSAMHSILVVDEQGKPLTNAILWSDTRSSSVAEDLRNAAQGEAIYVATGTPLHSMSPLCKIKWLQQCHPQLTARAAKYVSTKEFLWHQLFGEYVIDYSLASATGLFNIRQLRWEAAALRYAGIQPPQLSQPVPVAYSNRLQNQNMAAAMGLATGTLFFVGGSDGCLANLGSLCLTPSEVAITIGTSAAVRITSQTPVPNFEHMIFNYLLNKDTFVCGGAINNGGNVFGWLLKNLFAQHAQVSTYDDLFALIATVPPGSKGLLFLPYLHGERAPIWDEKSCGAFMGIEAAHTLAFFARAAAEGVCFALLHILTLLEEVCGESRQIAISGGLIHSGVMMQLLANVTGKKVVVQQADDASAVGAAFLAQKALGLIDDYASLSMPAVAMFVPEPQAVATYQKLFAVYKSLYPLLKSQMHLLHQFAH